ncbi:hypothetical protein B0H11DRAFT_2214892 [Mycena galericulata]|nr:hypothetical protein B0H11DRAFT_2214892 [Mycena galericulata]
MASASPPPGFRTEDEDGRPLDPYHHLRHPNAKSLLALLQNFDDIDTTEIDVLTAAATEAWPSLENLRHQFEGRTMPQELIELLFPLHQIHRKLPDDTKPLVRPYRPPFDGNRVYHIDPGWVMPPASKFYVPSGPAATSSAAARTPPAPQTLVAKVPASKSSGNSAAATSPSTAVSTPRAARSRGGTAGFARMVPSGYPVQRKKPKKKDIDTPSPSASDAEPPTSPRTTRSMTGSLPKPRASQSVPPAPPLTIKLPPSKSAPGRSESSGVCSGAKATPPDARARTPQRVTSGGTPSPESENLTSPALLFGKPGPALLKVPKPSHGQVFVVVPSVASALKTARSKKSLGKRKATTDLSIEDSDDSAPRRRRKTSERSKSPDLVTM